MERSMKYLFLAVLIQTVVIQAESGGMAGPREVVIRSGEVQLRGLFWRPRGRGPFPAILFNHGSGRSREELERLGPYERQAETLGPVFARHGYAFLYLFGLIVCFDSQSQQTESSFTPTIPKTWDEAALAEWATPVAGLTVRPTHISAKEYYAMPVENLRTYPVFFPGREPEGYWDMLQRVEPQPLIEPEKLKTEAGWID